MWNVAMDRGLLWARIAMSVCAGLLLCVPAVAQSRPFAVRQAHGAETRGVTSLRGCVYVDEKHVYLATDVAPQRFVLTGATSGLEKLSDREITVEGKEGEPVAVEGYSEPFRSFEVTGLVRLSPQWAPQLSDAFKNRAAWVVEKSAKYGVELAHPKPVTAVTEAPQSPATNFVTNTHAEWVSSFAIPETSYAGANLRGGSLSVFVNRDITNVQSCWQFSSLGPQSRAPRLLAMGKLQYMETYGGDAGMGTYSDDRYFHIFRNGLCYEVAFELREYNPRNAPTACNVPLLTEQDDANLIGLLLEGVAFSRPTVEARGENKTYSVPRVTEFRASSNTADDVTNRGQITFSWSTEDADYVELSYECANPNEAEHAGVVDLVISEGGPNRYCSNTASPKPYSTGPINHDANSSAVLGFGYFHHDEAMSVTVRIIAFSHGEAYPEASKSLTISVNPYNPFSRGVPMETRNMALAYATGAGGTKKYQQGSPLTITWTDEREQDPCVNLYLVQDTVGTGEKYLLQINGTLEIGCLKPASGGSYTWTVPTKYSGAGFRILARTPGGMSGVLGRAFDIIKNSDEAYDSGTSVIYTLKGSTNPTFGPVHEESFEFTAPGFITGYRSLTIADLDACTACIKSGITVEFYPRGTVSMVVPVDYVRFTDASGVIYGFFFEVGTFSADGTYKASDYPPYIVSNVGTLSIKAVRQ